MKINFDEIERNTGRKFETIEELYFFCLRSIEFLQNNNKNYTVKQYEKIDELSEIIKAVKIDD